MTDNEEDLLNGAGAGEEAVEVEDGVHGDRLPRPELENIGVEVGEGACYESPVLELHVDGLRELRELPADLLEVIGVVGSRRADPGEAENEVEVEDDCFLFFSRVFLSFP